MLDQKEPMGSAQWRTCGLSVAAFEVNDPISSLSNASPCSLSILNSVPGQVPGALLGGVSVL